MFNTEKISMWKGVMFLFIATSIWSGESKSFTCQIPQNLIDANIADQYCGNSTFNEGLFFGIRPSGYVTNNELEQFCLADLSPTHILELSLNYSVNQNYELRRHDAVNPNNLEGRHCSFTAAQCSNRLDDYTRDYIIGKVCAGIRDDNLCKEAKIGQENVCRVNRDRKCVADKESNVDMLCMDGGNLMINMDNLSDASSCGADTNVNGGVTVYPPLSDELAAQINQFAGDEVAINSGSELLLCSMQGAACTLQDASGLYYKHVYDFLLPNNTCPFPYMITLEDPDDTVHLPAHMTQDLQADAAQLVERARR